MHFTEEQLKPLFRAGVKFFDLVHNEEWEVAENPEFQLYEDCQWYVTIVEKPNRSNHKARITVNDCMAHRSILQEGSIVTMSEEGIDEMAYLEPKSNTSFKICEVMNGEDFKDDDSGYRVTFSTEDNDHEEACWVNTYQILGLASETKSEVEEPKDYPIPLGSVVNYCGDDVIHTLLGVSHSGSPIISKDVGGWEYEGNEKSFGKCLPNISPDQRCWHTDWDGVTKVEMPISDTAKQVVEKPKEEKEIVITFQEPQQIHLGAARLLSLI